MACVWWYICFQEEVAKEFGIPVQFQRYWLWTKRQNHSYRPNRPLTAQEEIQSVSSVWQSYFSVVFLWSELSLQFYWWCSFYISYLVFHIKQFLLGLSHHMRKRNDLSIIFLSVVWSYRSLPDNFLYFLQLDGTVWFINFLCLICLPPKKEAIRKDNQFVCLQE